VLFIPTSGEVDSINGGPVTRGQLYNLDKDRFFRFQFNPETYDWRQEWNWKPIQGNRDDTGGDLYFLNSGPRLMDLPLRFIADPGAPDLVYDTDHDLSTENLKMDFFSIMAEFRYWLRPIREKGRPCRLLVMFGKESLPCVITAMEVSQEDHFADLTVRAATIVLRLREWQTRNAA